jgi:3-methylcrotonyl-CoA carboxylase beta subunit
MSDETVIVRGTGAESQGAIFLAGPPLVKAATSEIITASELGGAEMHRRKSGVVDHAAANDEHAISMLRDIVARLNTEKGVDIDVAAPVPPRYDPAELTTPIAGTVSGLTAKPGQGVPEGVILLRLGEKA